MSAEARLDAREWHDLVKNVLLKGRNISGPLSVAYGTFGYADIMDHFSKEEGPDGKWAPRKPSTNRLYDMISSGRRAAPKGTAPGSYRSTNKILSLTGFLRQSISPRDPKRVDAHTIQVFANAKYSGQHDEGRGHLPERSFMWLSNDAKEMMAQFLVSDLVE